MQLSMYSGLELRNSNFVVGRGERGGGGGGGGGEIIKSSWWINDVVHHSTKRLLPI